MDVIRIHLGQTLLEFAVGPRVAGMLVHIVSESKIPLDMRIANLKSVYLVRSLTLRRVSSEIASPRNAELSHDFVPEAYQSGSRFIEYQKGMTDQENINGRLGEYAVNGGTSNVMNCNQARSQCLAQVHRFCLESCWPLCIWCHDDYSHAHDSRCQRQIQQQSGPLLQGRLWLPVWHRI